MEKIIDLGPSAVTEKPYSLSFIHLYDMKNNSIWCKTWDPVSNCPEFANPNRNKTDFEQEELSKILKIKVQRK